MDNCKCEGQCKINFFGELDEFNENPSDTENDDVDGESEENYGWDLFRSFPSKPKTGSYADNTFYERIFRLIKIITYLILFMLVFGGEILTKVTILFISSQIGRARPLLYYNYNEPEILRNDKLTKVAIVPAEERLVWYWCIVISFCIPELISLINSIYYFLFKKRRYPPLLHIFIICFFDGIHAIALAILFFIVIPQYNSIQSVTIVNCTHFIPTLLNLLTRNKKEGLTTCKFIFMIIGDITMLIIQIGIILTLSLFTSNIDIEIRWLLPFALIFSSCRWWPNYITSNSQIVFIKFLWSIKSKLELSRGITQGITALWRMLIFFIISIAIIYWQGFQIDKYIDNFPGIMNNMTISEMNHDLNRNFTNNQIKYVTINSNKMFFILSINVSAAFLTYSASKFACQTLMQRFGFALPSILTIPATISIIFFLDFIRWRDNCVFCLLFFNLSENFNNISSVLSQWEYWIWSLVLLSQIWTTMHIWISHCERLASANRLFTISSYDSLIIGQSLMLNRRKDHPLDDISNFKDFEFGKTSKTSEGDISENGPNIMKSNDRTTKIYACATMWHESDEEIALFINSILRLDLCQCAMQFLDKRYNIQVNDYFELETHIFFDDAFQCMHGCEVSCNHDNNETYVNDYVKSLIVTLKKSVEGMGMSATSPLKYPAPYGGRLEWLLPGKTQLIVHLKDKNKIRHRKRWSQVMYMYYLLGYRLMDQPIAINRKATIAENTYILTLDGDIDFKPTAVKVLLHLMKRDKGLGAACGRIHPIGSGPIVWFQKFEYAIGHWLQKSTEHIIGSVLCSPGCFSLFRAKALMEDNVMRKYATRSTDAHHYIQYDQGEDRWLCTLILQSGYRVEYSAASDSYTHAPETFNEFYNQRRRWIPSTIANICDLLNTSKETRKINENISCLYIAYQWALMASTVLGPGSIFLMLVGALVAAFRIDNWTSLYFNLIPLAIFITVCYTCKTQIQLTVAAIISAFYGLVMIAVLVGIMIQITDDGWVAPSTILFFVIAFQIITAGLLHPQELSCLLYGVVYYITVPSMYMLLIIYSIFNIHDVTWGTRETKIPFVQKIGFEISEDESHHSPNNNRLKEIKESMNFSLTAFFRWVLCKQNHKSNQVNKLDMIARSLNYISSRLDTLEKESKINENNLTCNHNDQLLTEKSIKLSDYNDNKEQQNCDNLSNQNDSEFRDFLINPHWIEDPDIQKRGTEFLSHAEENFWKGLIKKYLYPLEEDKKKMEKMEEALKKLRNENIFKFFMLNALFVLTVLLMQLNKKKLNFRWPFGTTYNISYTQYDMQIHLTSNYLQLEPVGCVFIASFLTILCIQFIAMVFHRFNTFLHLLANTQLQFNCCVKPKDISQDKLLENHAKDIVECLQRLAEENGFVDSNLCQLSKQISPRKRNTVHTLIENYKTKMKAPSNFDKVFEHLLTKSSNSQLTSSGMSEDMLKALNHRRTTMIDTQKNTQPHKNKIAKQSHSDNNKYGQVNHNYDVESAHTYNNTGFIDNENDKVNNDVLPHSHNQVKFNTINDE